MDIRTVSADFAVAPQIAPSDMAAIKALSTINTAQVQYFSTYGRFAQTLQELGPPPGGGLHDREVTTIAP